MPTLLSVGDVVRFDASFVEKLMKKLAGRPVAAAPSFCLSVQTPKGEQAVFADLASGAVERSAHDARVTLRLAAGELESALQGRISPEDFVRRIEIESTPPTALGELLTALQPEAGAAPASSRDLGGEAEERRYASAGGDGMVDEEGRVLKGKPRAFKVKAKAQKAPDASVLGGGRKGSDSLEFGRDNLVRLMRPIAVFAREQQAAGFRVKAGMASVKEGETWRELGRLGD
jgi:hypothetical protein